jgi:radical SAM protein with 4Fe4S-binding SPASM domain
MASLPTKYGPLIGELHKRAAEHRQPVNGTFELTSRCNLVCRMCYVRSSASDHVLREKELSATTWISLARQAVDKGMVFVLLTGGEVFLRSDFFNIYEPLTRMGLMITLFTNGTLISDAGAARLAQAPPTRTEITLYGATAATYDAVTGVRGSYARCCAGIEALVARGIPPAIKATVTRQNVSELEAMRQMARNWGLPFSGSWLLSRRPDGTASEVEDCRLSISSGVALEVAEDELACVHEPTRPTLRASSVGNDNNFPCYAGKAGFLINAAGEMNVCVALPRPAARPLEIGFSAAWEQVQRYVDSAPHAASACLACNAQGYCSRCPAWSLIESGTLAGPVPYLCEIARGRKECFERPA